MRGELLFYMQLSLADHCGLDLSVSSFALLLRLAPVAYTVDACTENGLEGETLATTATGTATH